MLVVVRVDVGCNFGSMWTWLVVTADVCLENPSKTNLELDTPVLVEEVVPNIF